MGCFIAIVAISAVMAFVQLPQLALFTLGAAFGGFAFALYPLCVAHSNDHLGEDERLSASSGLVLSYSAGAVAGPMLGSAGITVLGPSGLFILIGGVALLGTIFGITRMVVSAPIDAAEQQSYRALPRTSPMVAVLEVEAERE